ncbi:PD-(D/E)XK nuclease family protein [Oerskovia sp. M15]
MCPPAGPDERGDADGARGDGGDGDDDGPAGTDEERDPRRVQVGQPLDLRGLVASARSLLVEDLVRGDLGRRAARKTDLDDAAALAELLADLALAGVGEARPSPGTASTRSRAPSPCGARGHRHDLAVQGRVGQQVRCAGPWRAPEVRPRRDRPVARQPGPLDRAGGTARLALRARRGAGPPLARARAHAGVARHADAPPGRRHGRPARRVPPGLGRATARRGAVRAGGRESGAARGHRPGRGRGEGAVRVADLKTGKTKPSLTEAITNPQLGTYQLAVEGGALDLPEGTRSAGAQLVFVGDGKDAGLRVQPALEPEPDGTSWARDLVEDVADTMADSVFTARENKLCSVCPVRRSCPLMTEGRQVIA